MVVSHHSSEEVKEIDEDSNQGEMNLTRLVNVQFPANVRLSATVSSVSRLDHEEVV